MPKVSLFKTDKGIKKALIESLKLIGGIEKFIDHDDIVMLKPNLNGTEWVTNIELVESLIQLLIEYGVKKIMIAESTFGNEKMTAMCFQKTGYLELANKYNIELRNLNASEIYQLKVDKPLITEVLNVAKDIFEVDKIINIPIMKVHYATGITLSMKNLKGLLVGEEKRRFHEVGLDKCIIDLNNSIKPTLNIVDCTTCMEKMGPHGGEILNINLLIAGESSGEVDFIGSKVMGYSLDEVKHLKHYIEMNNIDIDAIEVLGEKVEDVKYNFKKVEMENLIPADFNIYDKNACSSCMNAFLMSCEFLGDTNIKKCDIYLGSDHEISKSESCKIAFGNCCIRDIKADKTVKGCPPFPFLLKKVFEDGI